VRKRLRIGILLGCGVLLVACGTLLVVWKMSQQVPEFYVQALEVDPAKQEEASDQMLERATALASDVRQEGRWKALFTAEQINGWLAVDMVKNHPDLLPRSVGDPRVAIEPDKVTVACRFQRGQIDTVLSLTADVYLSEPNVAALRIRKARAGMLPLPLEKVLERISEAANRLNLDIRRRQAEGDPVILISIPQRTEGGRLVRVESLRLGEGEIYLSGSTDRR